MFKQHLAHREHVKFFVVLGFMPAPPSYTSVVRRDKRKYAYIYQLIDKILPFAAGSSDRTVQLDLLQTR